jgi:PKD repeat protein
MQRIFSFVLVAGMLLGFVAPAGAQPSLGTVQKAPVLSAEKVEDLVFTEIEANGQTDFFVWMTTKADLSKAAELTTKEAKGQYVFDTVRATAEQTQKSLRGYLDAQGVIYRPFYIVNAIFVTGGNTDLVLELTSRPDVAKITANHKFQLQEPFNRVPAGPASPDTIEPNLTFINVDDVWAMGVTGEGTVMAGNDTGLVATHPAIAAHYRGCIDPPACTTWDHNYNWWDAFDEGNTEPWDDYGHGTHTTGTMVGDDGADNQIGVAPGAQTVHCKNMLGGGGDDAHFLECFEWDLAPWDLTGANANPDMAPDAVNNSWGYWGGGTDVFRDAINALQAAGVAVEVSAGNEGPGCQTLRSPGDYNEVLTTGSVDHIGQTFPGVVTSFSSRGPSILDGNYFPDIMAPGNSIRSSVYANSYEYWSGTSMAGPHATALVGLIWSACPSLQGDVETTYGIIHETAEPLAGQVGSCGGDYDVGPNNDWGDGTINAEAAVQMAIGMCAGMGALDGTVTDAATDDPIQDVHVVMNWDGGGSWSKDTDENGYYFREVPIGLYEVVASHPMYTTASVSGVEVFTETTTTQDFELVPRGILTGTVTDYDSGMALEGAMVMADDGTTAYTDADGIYMMYLDEGTFDVTASLENYASETESVVIVSGETTRQDFALMGAIAFTPAPVEITVDMGDVMVPLPATLINRQDFDYAFEFGEKDEGFIPVLNGYQTVVIPAMTAPADTGVKGASVPERSFTVPAITPMAGPNVLLLNADDDNSYGSPIQAELLAYGDLGMVDLFDARYATPTLAELEAYDVVVVWSNYVFSDPTGIGNVLADYVDGGGKVIDLNFAIDPYWGFSGRWVTEDYTAIKGAGTYYIDSCLGTFDAGHPIMEGVTDVCDIYRQGGTYLTPDSTEVALWGDGEYFVAVKDNIPVVTMNMYLGIYDYYLDQEDLVLHNAILWLAEGGVGVPWFGQDPVTGTVPAEGTLDVTLYFTATAEAGVTQPGDYLATLKIKGDPNKDIPVVMTVNPPDTWGKIFGNVSSQGYCDANPYPLEEAIVWMETGLGNIYSATTDVDGNYQWWLNEGENPVDVWVDFPEHVGEMVEDVMVDPAEPQEVNFELRWNHPCVSVTPESLSSELEWGDSSTQEMVIGNSGAAELSFEIFEADRGFDPAVQAARTPLPAVENPGTNSVLQLPAQFGTMQFDAVTPDAWNMATPYPMGIVRYGQAQCAGDTNSFYIIGGVSNGSIVADVNRYDADTDTWTPLAPMPGADEGPTAVCYDGKIYSTTGGYYSSGWNIYDIATDTWTSGASTPRGATSAIAAGWDGKIFLIGGDDDFYPGSGIYDTVEIYDIDSDTWIGTGASMPLGVSNAGFVQLGSFVYVVGGWSSTHPTNSNLTQRYDIEDDSWEVGPTFIGATADMPAAGTNEALYVMGGDADGGGYWDSTNTVWRYEFASWPGGDWEDLGDPLPAAIQAHFAGFATDSVVGGEVWSIGGLEGSTFMWHDYNLWLEAEAPYTGQRPDVPWLSEDVITGTIPADGGEQLVNVTMDSAGVNQPGEYYATLSIKSNDPVNKNFKVPVTMTVLPADDMGKLTGMVWDNCLGVPLEEVLVHIVDGTPITMTYTDENGEYTAWLIEGDYTVEFMLDGFVTFEADVTIVAGETLTLDVALVPDRPCIAVDPAVIEEWVLYDTEVYTFAGGLDLTNNGAQPNYFELMEVPGGYIPTPTLGVDTSWSVFGTANAPAGYQPTPATRTLSNRPNVGTVAIFKDANPWGSVATETILNMYGIPYEIHNSSEFGTLDFSQFGMIVISGDQPTSFYDAYGNNVQKFEDYVAGGGFLNFFSCDAGWNGGTLTDPLPGGIVWNGWIYENYNVIDDPSHPVAAGVPNPFYGNYASHGHFTTIPGDALIIASEQIGGNPTILEYRIGAGIMVAFGQPLEISYDWGWDAGMIIVNTLLYGNAFIPAGDVEWFWEEPVTGTVDALSTENVGIWFTSQYTDGTPMMTGTYTAQLFVMNEDDVSGNPKLPVILHVVDEYLIPDAAFVTDETACEDADVVFTNTTELGVPPVTDFLWDFGDGNTSTEENPVHMFADAGTYTVTLEACNRVGCTEFSQVIEILPKPEASFTFETMWLEATFTNASMYGDTYLWDFGDGITSTEMSPVHVFAAEGTYTVTLWVFNECGVAMFEAEVWVEQGYFYMLPLQFKAVPDEP